MSEKWQQLSYLDTLEPLKDYFADLTADNGEGLSTKLRVRGKITSLAGDSISDDERLPFITVKPSDNELFVRGYTDRDGEVFVYIPTNGSVHRIIEPYEQFDEQIVTNDSIQDLVFVKKE